MSGMKCNIGNYGPADDWKCDGETTNKSGTCDSCAKAGWTANPQKVAFTIANDLELSGKVQIESPIQPNSNPNN